MASGLTTEEVGVAVDVYLDGRKIGEFLTSNKLATGTASPVEEFTTNSLTSTGFVSIFPVSFSS